MKTTSSSSRPPHIKAAVRHLVWCVWSLGLATGAASTATAGAVFPDATHQGSNASLSLNARFTPDTAHLRRDVRVFALAWVPDAVTAQGQQGRWFARSAQGWMPVQAGDVWPQALALPTGVTDSSPQTLRLLNADDVRALMGAHIYLGYGLSSGDTASAMNEMLAQRRYRQIYTLNQSPSDTGSGTGNELGLEPANFERLQALFEQVQKKQADYRYNMANISPIPGNMANTSPIPGAVPSSPSAPVPAPAPAPSGTTSSDSAAIVSGTTLQEVGVDEDDLVKSDGAFVYSLGMSSQHSATAPYYTTNNPRDVLQRRRFNAANVQLSAPENVALPWSKGVSSGTGLFLDTERQQAIAVAQSGMYGGMYDAWFSSSYWQTGLTELAVLDTAALKIKRHLRLSGVLIGSRRIGATLYLVLRSHPQWPIVNDTKPGLVPQDNSKNTSSDNTTSASVQLPTLSLDQGPAQPLVNAADCLVSKNNTDANASADTITLVAVDLAASSHKHSARCFVGSTEAFYMSERNVYLATTRNTYSYSGRFPVYPQTTYTDIHQFALNGLEINYQGSGSVVGHLGFDQNRKSFRMGEHNGVLRVFTQTAQRFGGWIGMPVPMPIATSDPVVDTTTATPAAAPETDSPGKLTLLQVRDGALVTVGELPNAKRPAPLGKAGEQLYASRFIGNRGYLVTYRLIDPLYIVDLSDPTDPQVLGELEVSGYSDYLFPLSEHLLLGVGKEAIADSSGGVGDGRAAWYQGVKLSLIDISNPAQPVEAARSIIGKRGTDATVLRDHHGIALQTRPDTVRVSLPISLHDTPSTYTTGRPNDYYNFTRHELQKFEINLQTRTLNARAPLVSTGPQRDISSDRSVLWNDQVHYYMGNDWLSAPW